MQKLALGNKLRKNLNGINMARVVVPLYAKQSAKKGLSLRRQSSKSNKAGLTKSEASKLGIASGVERAKQLIRSQTISEDDARKVARFYARFKNVRTAKGEQALLLWGGRRYGLYLYQKFYGRK